MLYIMIVAYRDNVFSLSTITRRIIYIVKNWDLTRNDTLDEKGILGLDIIMEIIFRHHSSEQSITTDKYQVSFIPV